MGRAAIQVNGLGWGSCGGRLLMLHISFFKIRKLNDNLSIGRKGCAWALILGTLQAQHGLVVKRPPGNQVRTPLQPCREK